MVAANGTLLFPFVQFEFTRAVGPPEGRYVVDPDVLPDGAAMVRDLARAPAGARPDALHGATLGIGEAHVLVVSLIAAPASRPRLRRKARVAEDGPPGEVPVLRVTFVGATAPLADEHQAQGLLAGLRGSDGEQQRWVDDALRVLNMAVRAYRIGAHDPYAIEITRRDARRVRAGYGDAGEVAAGRWRAALEIPPPAGRRHNRLERLRPSEAIAGVLAGRVSVRESEDLLLRALIDLDNGRTRAAAQQFHAGIQLLEAELAGEEPRSERHRLSLAEQSRIGAELAATALERPLTAVEVERLESALAAVDDMIDAWRYEAGE